MSEEAKQGSAKDSEAAKENGQVRQRFRVERVAFIALVSIIAGVFGGAKTDLGPLGLMLMVGFIMACFYGGAKTLMGIGGFSEIVPAEEPIPAFDWKRFVLDPLYFLGVLIACLIVVGAAMLVRWAMSGGK